MSAPRILLTGAGGQLGTDVVAMKPDGLIAYDRNGLDITDGVAVRSVFERDRPDVVIHAAAFTAVDLCETEPDAAMQVNGEGTKNVVAAADDVGARVIYISTDYVFDGMKVAPYVETDEPNPTSMYGRSKLVGENAIGPTGLIVRTSWVCGANGSNMVKTILRLAETHETLTFVDDQIGKPSFTTDLAQALLALAARADTGVMHVTNEGVVSWYEFCRDVLDSAGLDPERVKPCATHELDPPRPAPRPANSVLANNRFADIGLPLLRDFREPLSETVARL